MCKNTSRTEVIRARSTQQVARGQVTRIRVALKCRLSEAVRVISKKTMLHRASVGEYAT